MRVPPSATPHLAVEWFDPTARTGEGNRSGWAEDLSNVLDRACLHDHLRVGYQVTKPIGDDMVGHRETSARARYCGYDSGRRVVPITAPGRRARSCHRQIRVVAAFPIRAAPRWQLYRILLGIARTVAGHLSDAHSASVALKALEQAFALDPSDRTGEISALLGETYFIQQQYGDAVRHLEAAAAKRPDDVNWRTFRYAPSATARRGLNCRCR